MQKKLLCTLGPSSLDERVIVRLTELGVSLFRLNLSHTRIEEVPRIVRLVREFTPVPICLDTEGAQVRTGALVDGRIEVRENSIVRIHRRRVPGDSHDFNLYPPDIIDEFAVGDFVHLDGDVLAQVIDTERDTIAMRALCGGSIGQNRAVTVQREIAMPPLTAKDRRILALGRELGIRHVALSFSHCAADVDELRQVAGHEASVISKIECLAGLANLREIAARSDSLLIDRGDLSRQVPIEQIPLIQKSIIQVAREAQKQVYVATNLMESMTSSPTPTRAEVNDVYNTLLDGADGLVLAAETTIGKYPIGCASMIVKLINEFESHLGREPTIHPSPPISLLVDPHGGQLVRRELAARERGELHRLPALRASREALLECEQIALGRYSPLTGFMGSEVLESVLHRNRLPDGLAWPLPIVLQVPRELAAGIGSGERLALTDADGRIHSVIDVAEVFDLDFEDVAKRWFGTASTRHPGVARLAAGGALLVGGEVALVERTSSPYRCYELTATQTRSVFTQKGWSRVVGFQASGVPHRVDEAMQLTALESSHADGLFINPILGPGREGDFLPDAVLKSYQTLLEFGRYPSGKTVLGGAVDYPRFAGPREAVFSALCQKNMGCSHALIGPEGLDPSDLYPREAIRKLFDELGELEIAPLFFEPMGYQAEADEYLTLRHAGTLPVNGEELRKAIRAGEELPAWFVRDLVQELLRAEIAAGRPVFFGSEDTQ